MGGSASETVAARSNPALSATRSEARYDLRHPGHTLAAATGASTKELMARMGHASARAALIYQHASSARDVAIAERLSAMAEEAMRQPGRHGDAGNKRGMAAEPIRARCGRQRIGVCGLSVV
jgi:hypothetical protein